MDQAAAEVRSRFRHVLLFVARRLEADIKTAEHTIKSARAGFRIVHLDDSNRGCASAYGPRMLADVVCRGVRFCLQAVCRYSTFRIGELSERCRRSCVPVYAIPRI